VPPYPETRTYVSRITQRIAFYSAAPTGGELGQQIVAAASTQLGVPYAWGGGTTTGPSEGFAQGRGTVGFDCSGLVRYAVAQASRGSIAMPRTADAQQYVGRNVPIANLQPGDLIGFTRAGETHAHHIGIYLGAGRMIHAPQTGGVVEVISLNTRYWKGQTWLATRVG
jgi:cell wall-associated NlpC family hydrolase